MARFIAASWSRARAFARQESGQTMTEYALIIAVVAIAAVAALGALNSGVSSAITRVVSALPK
jgi:Flp pilus assembly pilin Flp